MRQRQILPKQTKRENIKYIQKFTVSNAYCKTTSGNNVDGASQHFARWIRWSYCYFDCYYGCCLMAWLLLVMLCNDDDVFCSRCTSNITYFKYNQHPFKITYIWSIVLTSIYKIYGHLRCLSERIQKQLRHEERRNTEGIQRFRDILPRSVSNFCLYFNFLIHALLFSLNFRSSYFWA